MAIHVVFTCLNQNH